MEFGVNQMLGEGTGELDESKCKVVGIYGKVESIMILLLVIT
jgi:hypothetical protein